MADTFQNLKNLFSKKAVRKATGQKEPFTRPDMSERSAREQAFDAAAKKKALARKLRGFPIEGDPK